MATARKKIRPIRLPTNEMAKALTVASKRKNGLWLKVTRVGSVDVKAFTMLIKSEVVLVRRTKGLLVLSVGGHELRICGGNRAETPLHQWCQQALIAQEKGHNGMVLYANPKLFFDLY